MKLLRIAGSEASTLIPRLMAEGVIDRSAKIAKDGSHVLLPLEEGAWEFPLPGEVVEGHAHRRDERSPQRRILDGATVPEEYLASLPMFWEFVGDIAIVKMPAELDPWKEELGSLFAEVLGVSTVCIDRGGVQGELRQPQMEVIHGQRTESVRLENGIRYMLDVCKVMYASGNVDERERMGKLDCRGETVLDMFAGIGYFTLPIAKFSGAERVLACEKNPDSYHYLLKNIALNGLDGKVEARLGDNRSLPDRPFAHRIVMGYVQRTKEFLPKALNLLLPGGIIHYHENYHVREVEESLERDLAMACGGRSWELLSLREVKSFAPSVSHYVADLRFH